MTTQQEQHRESEREKINNTTQTKQTDNESSRLFWRYLPITTYTEIKTELLEKLYK